MNFVLNITNGIRNYRLITRDLKADVTIVACTNETLDARADVNNAVAETAIIEILSGLASARFTFGERLVCADVVFYVNVLDVACKVLENGFGLGIYE